MFPLRASWREIRPASSREGTDRPDIETPVVITGASGFLGGSIAARLMARGVPVTGLVRTLRPGLPAPFRAIQYDEDVIAALVAELKPALVIHAAGSASVAASMASPEQDFDSQVLLFDRLMKGIRRSGVTPRVVFLSSAAVYGDPDRLPVPEDAPLRPISPYGRHKLLAESLAREHTERDGTPTLILRLFSVFGPAQRRLLIWELFDQFRNRPEVVVDGTGEEARDYLYVDDLADAMLRLLASVDARQLTVNVASGTCITVRELAGKIGRILSSDKRVVFRGRVREGDPRRWQADVSRFERLVGAPAASDFDGRLAWSLRQWLA